MFRNKKIKAILSIIFIVFITANLFINYNKVESYSVSTKKSGIENFPDSYKSYLNDLKAKHPEWNFVAVYTHLDWNYVIENEMVRDRSLVPATQPSSWKLDGKNIEKGWVNASRSAVSYCLDPRNFLSESGIFQFEINTNNSSQHTLDVVARILKGTPMGEVYEGVDYTRKYKKSGKLVDMDKSYAQIIVDAGRKYNVSPVHLASRIIQENEGDILNYSCTSGSYPNYEGYYNFMNIGASPSGAGAIINALEYAKNKGWTTPELAIEGAAQKIYNSYIDYGQDTIYFEKFDVNFTEKSLYLFGGQYMTNILAPSSESSKIYDAYNSTNKLNSAFTFYIPVYDNMPGTTDIVDGEYIPDNTLVYLDDTSDRGVTDKFNVRSVPDGSIITEIVETKEGQENRTILTRILRGNNTGWDKVRLPNGIEGYVSSKYVKEYVYQKVTGVTLNETSKTLKLGESFNLTATVLPDNAQIKDVTWSSSNNEVAQVDASGKVTAKGPGSTTITVTTKDQNKTAKCDITVIAPVTEIKLSKNSYTVAKDAYLIITPEILPKEAQNKNYTITSKNPNIVKVEDKKLKAVAVGNTSVTFTTEDGGKTVVANISVIDLSSSDALNFDNSINVDKNENLLTKIGPDVSVEELSKKINYNKSKFDLVINNMQNKTIKNKDLVGTGTTINLVDKNNKDVVQTFTVVIYGDISGDGNINTIDLQLMQKSILKIKTLSNIQNTSADLNKDGGVPTTIDLQKLQKHILNISKIEQ